MQESIELKSNKYVLTLVMDPDVPFERILSDVSDKFRRSARFFRNGQMALEFSGRELEEGQKRKVIDAITSSCGLDIICVIEEDAEKEALQYQAIVAALADAPASDEEKAETAQVLTGSLKNGERYSSDRSILLLGNLEPGAELNSNGSIIVCGTAMGTIRAGVSGNEHVCVSALVLKPAVLEICSHRSVSGIRKRELDASYAPDPQVAVIEGGHLKIEPVSASAWEHLLARRSAGEEECV